MGKEKYLKQIEALFKESPVVSANSILRVIKSKKPVRQYHKQLIKNLVLKGKIKRLSKGCYTMHDEPSLAVFSFNPSYIGLQDALSFYNLWEQEAIPIIITSKKARIGIRKILDTNVLIRRIDRKYFFGFDYKKYGNFYLPVSDIEKTFIDMVYFRQRIDDELLKEFKRRLNRNRLGGYLKKYPKFMKLRVFNKLK